MKARIEELPKPKMWTPEAKMYVPVRDVEVAFDFPAFGPGKYPEVMAQVLKAGQTLSTGEQTAFMLDAVYNSEDIRNHPRAKSVRGIFENRWFWVPSVNVWTPKSDRNPGMYSVFDESGEGLSRKYTTEELEDRLSGGIIERGVRFSQDYKVAFAPLNTIRAGSQDNISNDGAHIAVYRPDGAEKLDAVAKNFRFKPRSYIVENNTDENIQTLSALNRSWNLNDIRLNAYFNSNGDSRVGYVLSVSGSESADNKS